MSAIQSGHYRAHATRGRAVGPDAYGGHGPSALPPSRAWKNGSTCETEKGKFQSSMWMTPTARDHKDGATTLANAPVNGLLGRQVLVTPMVGSGSCETRRTLNPLFVEALMAWPTGWTGFASVATAWSPWLRCMRCEISQLNCWPTDGVVA